MVLWKCKCGTQRRRAWASYDRLKHANPTMLECRNCREEQLHVPISEGE